VIALDVLKRGASGIGAVLARLDVDGPAGGLGFGWLMACVVLSGSPVAAIALSLLAAGTLDGHEALGMIGGSRLGASFVVLVIGMIDDARRRRTEKRSAYVGVAALTTTALVYAPALVLTYAAFDAGLLAGLRVEGRALSSATAALSAPVASALAAWLPGAAVFVAGVLTLLLAFRLVDAALPDLQARESPLTLAGRVAYRPWLMFLVGLAVTVATLSVSVSLSLLVPLAGKGYVRRENVVPYIMGANVTTLVDTAFAGALVGHPDALRMVALLMAAVTALSVPVVVLAPRPFERLVDRVASAATRDGRAVAVFVAVLFAVPLGLLVL
jgi:Na+/phosphate symporter